MNPLECFAPVYGAFLLIPPMPMGICHQQYCRQQHGIACIGDGNAPGVVRHCQHTARKVAVVVGLIETIAPVLIYMVHVDVCRVDDAIAHLLALRNGYVRMEVGWLIGARMIIYMEACEHHAKGQCVLCIFGLQ